MGGRASSTTASDGAAQRPAVIFGGWTAAVPKQKLLRELGDVLDKSTAREWLDEQPWTPGPRRGIALAGFHERQAEGHEDMKHRMQEVINLVNRAALSTSSTLDGCPVWATLSKERGERSESGNHVSKIRRVVHSFRLDISECECDYKEGSLWYRDQLVGSTARAPAQGLETVPGKVQNSWFSPVLFAAKAGKQVKEISDAWSFALAN